MRAALPYLVGIVVGVALAAWAVSCGAQWIGGLR